MKLFSFHWASKGWDNFIITIWFRSHGQNGCHVNSSKIFTQTKMISYETLWMLILKSVVKWGFFVDIDLVKYFIKEDLWFIVRWTYGPLISFMVPYNIDDWIHCRLELSPRAGHFRTANHDFMSHASVWCLEHNKYWSDSARKIRESYWIRRLKTLKPFDIN